MELLRWTFNDTKSAFSGLECIVIPLSEEEKKKYCFGPNDKDCVLVRVLGGFEFFTRTKYLTAAKPQGEENGT
jgi:hypothetical protein